MMSIVTDDPAFCAPVMVANPGTCGSTMVEKNWVNWIDWPRPYPMSSCSGGRPYPPQVPRGPAHGVGSGASAARLSRSAERLSRYVRIWIVSGSEALACDAAA